MFNIEIKKGDDWNWSPAGDTRPTIADFKHTVANYLTWEVDNILKQRINTDDSLGK